MAGLLDPKGLIGTIYLFPVYISFNGIFSDPVLAAELRQNAVRTAGPRDWNKPVINAMIPIKLGPPQAS